VADFNALAFNHRPEITAGVRAEECAALLRDFFARLREKRFSCAEDCGNNI
jgi:tRNA(adenine34) deaminase